MSKKYRFRIIGNPVILVYLVFRNGIHWRYIPRLLFYLFKALVFFPFYCIESILYRSAFSATAITDHPVFIIGHHRSGTSLLHKLLAADQQFTYFKNSDILFPRIRIPGRKVMKNLFNWTIKKLNVKSFAYNNVLFDPDDPQEEDMCIAGMFEQQSFYWDFVFPKTAIAFIDDQLRNGKTYLIQAWKDSYLYHLRRIQYFNKHKKLILKNPPNTVRLRYILDLFPDARFIFIYRDPLSVIYSVRRLWKKGLGAFSLQSFDDDLIEQKIFKYYRMFNDAYQNDKYLIPGKNLVEVRYEDLETDPLAVIKTIYSRFNWDFSTGKELIIDKIDAEKSYRKFSYEKDILFEIKVREALKNCLGEDEYYLA